jgi:hypothetical protein
MPTLWWPSCWCCRRACRCWHGGMTSTAGERDSDGWRKGGGWQPLFSRPRGAHAAAWVGHVTALQHRCKDSPWLQCLAHATCTPQSQSTAGAHA